MYTLILLRHGESEWNSKNLFTGWVDCDLTNNGILEAVHAGELIKKHNLTPQFMYTSVLTRAIRTANLCLEALGTQWMPVKRSWRLNERHYGALQGKNKKKILQEYGEKQFMAWRRSFDIPPPKIDSTDKYAQNNDPRYSTIDPKLIPLTESLKIVYDRLMPYWQDSIIQHLQIHKTILIVAHGNSIRALIKHLDNISDEKISSVNIPTGIPLVYTLSNTFMPKQKAYYLDPDAAKKAIDKVSKQGK